MTTVPGGGGRTAASTRGSYRTTLIDMSAARVTVTLPAELHEAAQHAARSAGVPFSAVVSDALAHWVRGQLVDAWLVAHQETHGPFREDELRDLAGDAGVPYLPAGRARRTPCT